MNSDVKEPDVVGYQVINMFFPPDDQPNLAEINNQEESNGNVA